MASITFKHVNKTYPGNVTVVPDLNLEIQDKEFVILVGPSGIRVNCIAPGVIDTEMNGNLTPEVMAQLREETPLGTIGTPKQVADLALYLAGEGASFLTGQVISPNGGFLI